MKRAVIAGVIAAFTAAACGSTSPIEDQAQPVVDALRAAEVPHQYQFTYIPASPSPFLACLDGVDQVEVAADWDLGVVRLQPRRDAPAVFVTEAAVVVAQQVSPDVLTWTADLDSESLADVFGTSLARFVETGIRSPDPNTTIDALIDIAVGVRLAPTPPGLEGDTISITVDPDQFNTASNGEAGSQAPTITATIDGNGLVAGYLVSDLSTDSEPDPITNYAVVIDYEPAPKLSVPQVADERSSIDEIAYPSAQDSCHFEG